MRWTRTGRILQAEPVTGQEGAERCLVQSLVLHALRYGTTPSERRALLMQIVGAAEGGLDAVDGEETRREATA